MFTDAGLKPREGNVQPKATQQGQAHLGSALRFLPLGTRSFHTPAASVTKKPCLIQAHAQLIALFHYGLLAQLGFFSKGNVREGKARLAPPTGPETSLCALPVCSSHTHPQRAQTQHLSPKGISSPGADAHLEDQPWPPRQPPLPRPQTPTQQDPANTHRALWCRSDLDPT